MVFPQIVKKRFDCTSVQPFVIVMLSHEVEVQLPALVVKQTSNVPVPDMEGSKTPFEEMQDPHWLDQVPAELVGIRTVPSERR